MSRRRDELRGGGASGGPSHGLIAAARLGRTRNHTRHLPGAGADEDATGVSLLLVGDQIQNMVMAMARARGSADGEGAGFHTERYAALHGSTARHGETPCNINHWGSLPV